MRKMKLDLAELSVDTFDVAGGEGGVGTVAGRAAGADPAADDPKMGTWRCAPPTGYTSVCPWATCTCNYTCPPCAAMSEVPPCAVAEPTVARDADAG